MTQPRPPVPPAPAAPLGTPQHTHGRGDLTGCPWHDVKAKLRKVGLRPTLKTTFYHAGYKQAA